LIGNNSSLKQLLCFHFKLKLILYKLCMHSCSYCKLQKDNQSTHKNFMKQFYLPSTFTIYNYLNILCQCRWSIEHKEYICNCEELGRSYKNLVEKKLPIFNESSTKEELTPCIENLGPTCIYSREIHGWCLTYAKILNRNQW